MHNADPNNPPRVLLIMLGHVDDRMRDRFGDYDALFAAGLGLKPAVWNLVDQPQAAAPDITKYDGIILSGGKAMVTDGGPWLTAATAVVRQALERKHPLLGVCLGHQVLGYVAGGTVGYHAQRWMLGSTRVQLNPTASADTLLGDFPPSFAANVSHQQALLTASPAITTLGCTDYDPHHVIRVGSCAWGVQFHPEFTAPYVRASLALKAEALDAVRGPGYAARASALVTQTPLALAVLRRFADDCHARHQPARQTPLKPQTAKSGAKCD